jgi:hypothetical protein
VLHAFLPGTSGGQGIVDALTGSYIIRPNGQSDTKNSLSFDWPKTAVIFILFFRRNWQDSLSMRLMAKCLLMLIHCLKLGMGLVHLLDELIYVITTNIFTYI